MQESFFVLGNVQQVYFRATFVGAAKRRGLRAGASNDVGNLRKVFCSLEGEEKLIEEFKKDLLSLPRLNSRGAKVEQISLIEWMGLEGHQVSTEKVQESFEDSGVKVYL